MREREKAFKTKAATAAQRAGQIVVISWETVGVSDWSQMQLTLMANQG